MILCNLSKFKVNLICSCSIAYHIGVLLLTKWSRFLFFIGIEFSLCCRLFGETIAHMGPSYLATFRPKSLNETETLL